MKGLKTGELDNRKSPCHDPRTASAAATLSTYARFTGDIVQARFAQLVEVIRQPARFTLLIQAALRTSANTSAYFRKSNNIRTYLEEQGRLEHHSKLYHVSTEFK